MSEIRTLSDQTSDLNAAFGLIDEAAFAYATVAKGRKLILPPEIAQAVQHRSHRLKPAKPPAIQNLLNRAYQLREKLDTTPGLTRSSLARKLKLDPSRVTQILNLLNLAPEIQNRIYNLPPTTHRNTIGDRAWMRLARIRDHAHQVEAFEATYQKRSTLGSQYSRWAAISHPLNIRETTRHTTHKDNQIAI